MPAPPRPPAAPKEWQPADVRDDLQMRDCISIRDAVACPVCAADVNERCRGDNGTLAFLHHGRVAASADAAT